MITNKLSAIALLVIALSQASQAVAIYGAEYGGVNVCVGNLYCYHIAQDKESGL
jgi:thiamine transporter ThiT